MSKATTTSRHLVVLHGWTLNPMVREKWQPFLKLLKEAGFRVHFWELPGLANSPQKPLTLADYTNWLAKKTRSMKPFILLGHSFGGQLATRFTRLHPKKVSQLILVDSSGLIDQSLPKKLKRAIFKLAAKTGKKLTQSITLRRLLYRLSRETDYYQASPMQRKTMQNILADEVRKDLPQITTPTLVIWGERDKVTPPKLGRVFAKNIPQAKMVIVPEARHTPVYTHAQAVLTAITTFLES